MAAAQNVPPGSVDQQTVKNRLHAGQLRGHLLTQAGVITQCLRLNATHDALGLGNQVVQLFIGAHVELPKPFKEFGQVRNCRIAEDLGLAVVLTGDAFGQMGDQLGQFACKCFFGQPNRLVKAG